MSLLEKRKDVAYISPISYIKYIRMTALLLVFSHYTQMECSCFNMLLCMCLGFTCLFVLFATRDQNTSHACLSVGK